MLTVIGAGERVMTAENQMIQAKAIHNKTFVPGSPTDPIFASFPFFFFLVGVN